MNIWYHYVHPSDSMKTCTFFDHLFHMQQKQTPVHVHCDGNCFYFAFVLQQVYVSFFFFFFEDRTAACFIQSTLFPTLDSHDPTLTSFVACSDARLMHVRQIQKKRRTLELTMPECITRIDRFPSCSCSSPSSPSCSSAERGGSYFF